MNCYQWSDLRVGLSHAFEVQLTSDMMDAFAGISGDTNPLHLDRRYATQCGYSDPVAYGLLTSVFYSQLVGVHLPGKYALLHGIDIDFISPAYPGDILNVSGEISHLNEAFRQIEIRANIKRQEQQIVSKAKLRVGLRPIPIGSC
jgi:3-hydroxybutyryl-CoA dehydratase